MPTKDDPTLAVDAYIKTVDSAIDRFLAYDRFIRESPPDRIRDVAEMERSRAREKLRMELRMIFGYVTVEATRLGRESVWEEIRDEVVHAKPKKKRARPKKKAAKRRG